MKVKVKVQVCYKFGASVATAGGNTCDKCRAFAATALGLFL